MARWEKKWYEEELRKLIAQTESADPEEPVACFAKGLLADYPPEEVAAYVKSLRAKHNIRGEDAQAAFKVYEAHILSRVPATIRLLWALFKKVLSSWVVSSSPERVVIRTPSSSGKILCPVIKAAKGDLEKARPLCEALFRHDAFGEPMSTLAIKAVNPRLRWELQEFRNRPDFPCYYAIVLDE